MKVTAIFHALQFLLRVDYIQWQLNITVCTDCNRRFKSAPLTCPVSLISSPPNHGQSEAVYMLNSNWITDFAPFSNIGKNVWNERISHSSSVRYNRILMLADIFGVLFCAFCACVFVGTVGAKETHLLSRKRSPGCCVCKLCFLPYISWFGTTWSLWMWALVLENFALFPQVATSQYCYRIHEMYAYRIGQRTFIDLASQ